MPRTWFSPAVTVETEQPGQCYAVTSVEKAAELLLDWPNEGPEWRRAVEACTAARQGEEPASAARSAFLAAARAAGRLID